MVGSSTRDADVVAAARTLLDEHGLRPDVPVVLDVDPEPLLARILATAPAPTQRRAHGPLSSGRPRARATATAGPAAQRPRRGSRRRAALASLGAVAVVVALLAAQSTHAQPATAAPLPSLAYTLADPTETAPSDLPDARETLLRLADSARGAVAPAPSGTVQHIVTQDWLAESTIPATGSRTFAVYPTVTHRWVASDGSGQISQHRSAAVNPDGTLDLAAAPSSGGRSSTDTFLAGGMDATLGTGLSRDPAVLTTQLLDASPAGCSVTGWSAFCLADQVQDHFLAGVVAPDLAGSFWEALADQPDVGLLGATTDRVGRPGTAVAVAVPSLPGETGDERTVLVLIVSETTGQMLSTEQVVVHSDALDVTVPRVTGFSAITRSEFTSAVGR